MKAIKTLFLCFLVFTAFLALVHAEDEDDDDDDDTPDQVDPALQGQRVGLKTDDEVVEREEEKMSHDGFSIKEKKVLRDSAEKFQFQAEVHKLMNIIINSLYSNKDIFLRELISNASDALDKIRFLSLTNQKLLGEGDQAKLDVKIEIDKETNTIHITDRGIGMTRDELKNNLGTIAKSGTKEFLESMAKKADMNLIGQFGVGFYSVFLVADVVSVISKHNNDKQYIWESTAQDSFSIIEDPRGNTLGRGTRVSLHLKEDSRDYLDHSRIKELVKRYSEFISYPIYLWNSKQVEVEVPVEEEKKEEKKETTEPVVEEEEKKEEEKPKTKKEQKTEWFWDLLNDTKPIWLRSPKEVTQEDYDSFYKSITKDSGKPLAQTHFSAEGEMEFKSILYIPEEAPHDLFRTYGQKSKSLKLYVKRVFITDDFEDLMPGYLSFIKGVVDSDDLPLNVSREILQQNSILKMIKKKLVRKAIELIKSLADGDDADTEEGKKEAQEKYAKFWKNFGTSVKLGVIEDQANKTRLSKLIRFLSSKSENKLTSLNEYVSRMKDGQEYIYYLAGENLEAVKNSPLLEGLVGRGYEVLYLVDPIDEYTAQHIGKFEGKELINISTDNVHIKESKKEKRKLLEEKYKPLSEFIKSKLGKKIDKVTISQRLTDSPCALVTPQFGYSANMERLMKAQALSTEQQKQFLANAKKILEINPRHPIIKELNTIINTGADEKRAEDLTLLLYQTSLLTSGFTVDDTADFATRIQKILKQNLNIDPNAKVEPEEEDDDDDDVKPTDKTADDEEEVIVDKKPKKDEL